MPQNVWLYKQQRLAIFERKTIDSYQVCCFGHPHSRCGSMNAAMNNDFVKTPNTKYVYNILLIVKYTRGKHDPSSYTQETKKYRKYRSGDTERPHRPPTHVPPSTPRAEMSGHPLPVGCPSVSEAGKRF